MKKITKQELADLKKQYPIETKVRLMFMEDAQAPASGTIGRVLFIDDIGTIHISWENGSSLGIIPGVDLIEKI